MCVYYPVKLSRRRPSCSCCRRGGELIMDGWVDGCTDGWMLGCARGVEAPRLMGEMSPGLVGIRTRPQLSWISLSPPHSDVQEPHQARERDPVCVSPPRCLREDAAWTSRGPTGWRAALVRSSNAPSPEAPAGGVTHFLLSACCPPTLRCHQGEA